MLKPYAGQFTKLILAFDVGTTSSGISYCLLKPGEVPRVLDITRQGQPPAGDARTPSLLFYDKSGNVRAAGGAVLTDSVIETALQEQWTKAEWWKLHLHPKSLAFSVNMRDEVPPLPPGKSAVDVLSDFITYLYQCSKTYIRGCHLIFPWTSVEDSIEYIFTYPNGWECVQHQYLQAIECAGLIPSTAEGRSRVYMLTEGEAALHCCLTDPRNRGMTEQVVPQGVLILDAGGVTTALSLYSIKVGKNYCEIAPAKRRLQGSAFVTRRAMALLKSKLEGWEHSSAVEIADFTREFDHTTKLVIKSDQEPAYVRVAGRHYNNSKYNVSFGQLKLSGKEATGLFGQTVDVIIELFEHQLKYSLIPITAVFLVGGLSRNDWVFSRFESYFKGKKIVVCRPRAVERAIANGAVLAHINRIYSRNSVVYVLPVKEIDPKRVRRKGQWEVDLMGDSCPAGYFECDTHQMVLRQSFSLTTSSPGDLGMRTIRIEDFRGSLSNSKHSDRDQHPFSTLCTISADLSEAASDLVTKQTASGEVYHQLDYEVIVLFGLAVLQAQVGWTTAGGERRIPATVL